MQSSPVDSAVISLFVWVAAEVACQQGRILVHLVV